MDDWRPISTPPKCEGRHSIRLLGLLDGGTHVFCQYTPFYLGRSDEHKMLWICEGYGWETKPTHWTLLPKGKVLAKGAS
jgi:hypothetical protein